MSAAQHVPTRAAILTSIGHGGIAVVRVVGGRAHEMAAELFRPLRPLPSEPCGRCIHYGHIVDGDHVIDEVLVRMLSVVEAPSGKPTVDVSCHGGIVAVQRVLACFARRGAEPVEAEQLLAGEHRSLVRTEAAGALIHAATSLACDTFLDQMNGALDDALTRLPWDDARAVRQTLCALLATVPLGTALARPPSVALVGPSNAGKSTLFNAIARQERVIVSATPGTTRDVVRAEVAIGGLAVWLTDTAGQRESACTIEREAMERARAAGAGADLEVRVFDASAEEPGALAEATARPVLTVLNKADRGLAAWTREWRDAVPCSAVTGEGVAEVASQIVERLVGAAGYEAGRAVVFTARQAERLREAVGRLDEGDGAGARASVSECLGAVSS